MPRGRPRDEQAKQRILDAAFELVGTTTAGRATIDEIAVAADVGKQTIYRWWPSRSAVVLDALVVGTMRETPFPETDDIRADFAAHLRSVVRLFNSPSGQVVKEILGDAQSDEATQADFCDRFWQPRRDLSLARLRRGIDRGLVRTDIDAEVVLDAIYGPLWLRLLIGHQPIALADADRIVDAMWTGIERAAG